MTQARQLKLISAILQLRKNASTDFNDFGADNVLEALHIYLAPSNSWNSTLIAQFEELLSIADLDVPVLRSVWGTLIGGGANNLPEMLRPLIKEFRDYHNQNPGSTLWPLRHDGKLDFAKSLAGAFDYEVSSELKLRAYASPPLSLKELIPTDKAVLSVAMQIRATADADTVWPFKLASLAASADGTRELLTQSYFKHEPGRLIGAALVADMKRLNIPFSRNYVSAHFLATPSLVQQVYRAKGEASISAGIGLVAPLSYGPLVGAQLSVSAGYHLSCDFETRISRQQDGNINIKLDSRRVADISSSAELGVRLDMSQALTPIHEMLCSTLGEARELIDTLQTEWTLANGYDQLLSEHLEGLSDDPTWRSFVATLVSPEQGSDLVTMLRQDLSERLQDRQASWHDTVASLIDNKVDKIFDRLTEEEKATLSLVMGGRDPQRLVKTRVRSATSSAADQFLESAVSNSEELISGLVKSSNSAVFKAPLGRLEATGKKIADLRAQLLYRLDKYVTYLVMIERSVKAISENQLLARINYYRSRSRGNNVLADVTLTPQSALIYADEVDDLLAGKPDRLMAVHKAENDGIRVNKSMLGEFVNSKKSRGFSLAVLDFKMQRQSLLNSDVEIVEDQITGMITVGTRAAISKAQTLAKDSRSIELVSVAQLCSAKLTGVGGLSAAFNRREDRLDQEELTAFLQGFVDAGLMTSVQHRDALARAYESTGAALDVIEDAEIIAGVQWNNDQLQTLFSLENPLGHAQVYSAVVETAELLQVFDEAEFSRINRLLGRADRIESTTDMITFFTSKKGKKLRKKLKARRSRGRPSGGSASLSKTRMREREVADKACKWSENIDLLYRAIKNMREIYHSCDNPWTKKRYRKRQDKLNKQLREWVQLPGIMASLYAQLPWASHKDDRVKDATLALIATLTKLADRGDLTTALSVQMRLTEGPGMRTIRLV